MMSIIFITDDIIIYNSHYSNLVFEGAQGLLLDQNNIDYMPNLTPSNIGLKNVVDLLNKRELDGDSKFKVCYVARSYFTRHGAGKFETEVKKEKYGVKLSKYIYKLKYSIQISKIFRRF